MEQALSANEMIVGIFTSVISWGAFIVVLVVLRNFIVMGITAAAINILSRGDTTFNRLIIRRLTDKNVSAKELYEELREHYEEKEPSQASLGD